MANILRGVDFPLCLDGKGNLTVATDANLIASHIIHMILVPPGDNPMRPTVGIPDRLFDSIQDFSLYASDVQRRLTQEIPQASIQVTSSFDESGEGLLNVVWSYQGVRQEDLEVRLN